MRFVIGWLIAVLSPAIGRPLSGQQRPADLPLAESEAAAIVRSFADSLDHYYSDTVGVRIVGSALRRAANDTLITNVRSSLTLASRVQRLIRSVSQDQHLRFGYSFAPGNPADHVATAEELAQERRDLAAMGFGIRAVERLEGNVAYIDMRSFEEPEDAADIIAGVMRLCEGADALILDLRENYGGSPEMVQFFASFFFKTPTPISDVYFRFTGENRRSSTLAWVPGPRFEGPMYILTSGATFSAAEGFTYLLQQRKRATVVGEKTKGGAHPTRTVVITPHFAAFIPVGVVRDAVTHTDWESTGVEPDVAASAKDALRAALSAIRPATQGQGPGA